ncbi:MAG: hypothetical protein Q8L35_05390 [Actinomycetota bacterium]|nr:hypothetical protein [Actinomycetota bacterium]
MINKNKSQRWVKIVAWLLAISFGLGMTLLLAIPTPNDTSAPNSPAPAAKTSLTPITSGKTAGPADGAIGQGDLAMKSGKIDQAIGFYETAYQLDRKDKTIREKLRDAYKRYLQLLPDGPQVKQVKAALENL